jgi:hypothetical protein
MRIFLSETYHFSPVAKVPAVLKLSLVIKQLLTNRPWIHAVGARPEKISTWSTK